MAEQKEQSRPHGDPMEQVIAESPETNRAQRDSDAPPDATSEPGDDRLNNSDRADGKGSDANGIPPFDEAEGERRKKLYDQGAGIVSRID
jgi:hypothetical protein